MAIRRRCKHRKCKNARRCLEHLQFDMEYQGTRFRVAVNDFAIPRMEPGRQRPIESMEEARDWERLFIGEVKAGRDPRRPPSRSIQAGAGLGDVAAMNWGMAQTPPLFNKSPFHRFGVRLNKKAETTRDRRILRDEEKRLLDAALQKMNTAEHGFVGALLHDRIIGALEL